MITPQNTAPQKGSRITPKASVTITISSTKLRVSRAGGLLLGQKVHGGGLCIGEASDGIGPGCPLRLLERTVPAPMLKRLRPGSCLRIDPEWQVGGGLRQIARVDDCEETPGQLS